MSTSETFRADIRLFQDDLAAGKYVPKWIKQAQEASKKRAEGEFDDWKVREQEAFWGQKQKLKHGVIAGESRQHTMEELLGAGCFQVGDTWRYQRSFGRGSKRTIVEKEAKASCYVSRSSLTVQLTQ